MKVTKFLALGWLVPFFASGREAKPTSYLENAMNAVVTINGQRHSGSAGPSLVFEPLEWMLGLAATQAPQPKSDHWSQSLTTGSGFFFGSKCCFVITNYHVLSSADEISLVSNNQKKIGFKKVTYFDSKKDLAIIEVESNDFEIEKHTLKKSLVKPFIGQKIYAIGNPQGYGISLTSGIISGMNRHLSELGNGNLIQSDLPLNPGYSGGPLLNEKGEILGINLAIDKNSQGISFSIPLDYVENEIKKFTDKSATATCYLGLVGSSISTPKNNQIYGVLVEDVKYGSLGEKSGIQKGDIILKFMGKKLFQQNDLEHNFQERCIASKNANLVIYRYGKLQKINLNSNK